MRDDALSAALFIAPWIRRIEAVENDLRVEADDGQQIVEVVGDSTGQAADCVHLLRLTELLLEISALGKIDRDAHKSEDAAFLIEDRRSGKKRGECLSRLSLDEKLSRPALSGGPTHDDFLAMVAEEWRGSQLLGGSANRFLGGPSVKVLGELVPEDHNTLWIRGHHCLLHGIEELRLESYRSF